MSILKKEPRYPRNGRCPCGSDKKHKYCCLADTGFRPAVVSQAVGYIDAGEEPVRHVITDARGTSFFATTAGEILVFAKKADAFAIATAPEFTADAAPGEINVAGVGPAKWAHLQATLPFIEPTDVKHAAELLRDRVAHRLRELEAAASDQLHDNDEEAPAAD